MRAVVAALVSLDSDRVETNEARLDMHAPEASETCGTPEDPRTFETAAAKLAEEVEEHLRLSMFSIPGQESSSPAYELEFKFELKFKLEFERFGLCPAELIILDDGAGTETFRVGRLVVFELFPSRSLAHSVFGAALIFDGEAEGKETGPEAPSFVGASLVVEGG